MNAPTPATSISSQQQVIQPGDTTNQQFQSQQLEVGGTQAQIDNQCIENEGTGAKMCFDIVGILTPNAFIAIGVDNPIMIGTDDDHILGAENGNISGVFGDSIQDIEANIQNKFGVPRAIFSDAFLDLLWPGANSSFTEVVQSIVIAGDTGQTSNFSWGDFRKGMKKFFSERSQRWNDFWGEFRDSFRCLFGRC